jgi:hypothetical protein
VRRLDDPRMSPSGTRVLIQSPMPRLMGGAHMWAWSTVASNQTRQLTYSPPSDKEGEHQARWLGDETCRVSRQARERTELFQLSLTGGEATPLLSPVLPPVDASKEPDAYRRARPSARSSCGTAPSAGRLLSKSRPVRAPSAILARDPETPGEKTQKDEKADAILGSIAVLHGKRSLSVRSQIPKS